MAILSASVRQAGLADVHDVGLVLDPEVWALQRQARARQLTWAHCGVSNLLGCFV